MTEHHINISEARRKLFDLVDEVLREPGSVVLIRHRDRQGRVALVSESYLASLRKAVAKLLGSGASGFRLEGSLRLASSEEELDRFLSDARTRQAALAEAKSRLLGGGAGRGSRDATDA